MLQKILIFIALNTASVFFAHQLLDDFVITGGTFGFVVVGIIIGLLNCFLRPLIKVLSLPFIILTAGLFIIVVNVAILWFAEFFVALLDISGLSFTITGLTTYVAAVFLLGILNYLFQKILR